MKHKRVLGTIALLVALLSILAVSIWFAAEGWMSVDGSAIPLAGYVAMAAGIFFTLVVGIGLMSLVFYSHRQGYDDAADRGHSERED
jgi:riboflavin transporter FmnP